MDATFFGTRPVRRIAALGFGAVMAALLVLPAPRPAYAATFTVNSTGDAPDANINNAVCDSNAFVLGNQCTLRAAIQEANDTPGADTINFDIGGQGRVKTISPNSQLPVITEKVAINGYSQPGASPNTLAVGNDAVLKIQLSGANAGLTANGLVIGASSSTVKGLVINRFDDSGIAITNPRARGNRVEGNFIGTNAAGTAALGNVGRGVQIVDASGNTVGGTAPGARNVISGNEGIGVYIDGSSSVNNAVLGNYIGPDKNGDASLGNTQNGVQIFDAPDNTVGGTAAGAGNLVSGNFGPGISILSADAPGNEVLGNAIRQNTGDGVLVFGGEGNTIGGGNVISSNGGDGVDISVSQGNRVLSNQIFSNSGLGIELLGGLGDAGGVTTNDEDDPDTGPNNRQNFPVITSARRLDNGLTIISGTLNSNPGQDFTVQCFVAAPDPSAHGEGRFLAGQDTTVTTNANGNASFACASPVPQPGQAVTATATNTATGDTSEFSRIIGVVAG